MNIKQKTIQKFKDDILELNKELVICITPREVGRRLRAIDYAEQQIKEWEGL